MNNRLRFVRSCVMALGMVLAVACGHGPPGVEAVERVGSQAQAVDLAWPVRPVVSAGKVGTLPGGGGVGPAGDYHFSQPFQGHFSRDFASNCEVDTCGLSTC